MQPFVKILRSLININIDIDTDININININIIIIIVIVKCATSHLRFQRLNCCAIIHTDYFVIGEICSVYVYASHSPMSNRASEK